MLVSFSSFFFSFLDLLSTIRRFIDNFIIIKLYNFSYTETNFEAEYLKKKKRIIDFSSKPLSLLRASPAATFSKKLYLSKKDKIPREGIIHVDKARSPSRRRGVCCTLGRERGVCACARSEVSPLSFSRSACSPRSSSGTALTVKVSAFHGHRDHARPTHSRPGSAPRFPPRSRRERGRAVPIRGRVLCSSSWRAIVARKFSSPKPRSPRSIGVQDGFPICAKTT